MSLDYAAEPLADSLSPDGVRLTTLSVTHPRFILAEVNTHRMMSRNSASSRAIPPELHIQRVIESAFVPETFNERVKGMGVGDAVSSEVQEMAKSIWLEGAAAAVDVAKRLCDLGLDKSRVNRVLEPYMWHSAIISATEWSNFFGLRDHPGAQPEFQILAKMMREAMWDNEPQEVDYDYWHLPGISGDELGHLCDYRAEGADVPAEVQQYKTVSARRMARVSFDKHTEGEEWGVSIERAGVLMTNGHVSPLEHQARPVSTGDIDPDSSDIASKISLSPVTVQAALDQGLRAGEPRWWWQNVNPAAVWCGNFRGWIQFRKELPNEDNFARHLAEQEVTA